MATVQVSVALVLAIVEAIALSASRGGASRQAAAAMVSAAIRTACSFSSAALDGQDAHADSDLEARAAIAKAELSPHKALNKFNGRPAHHMGDALRAAKPSLAPSTATTFRKLQRSSAVAKHSWTEPPTPSESTIASDCRS